MRRILGFCYAVTMIMLLLPTSAYAGQWQQDTNGWRYQDDDGAYQIGWFQDVDGKWYFFDEQSTYMLTDTVTPDGYKVSGNGEWVEGNENNRVKYNEFDNKTELEVSSYDSPFGAEALGFTLPVTVYYNNEYNNVYGGNIKITETSVSKDGIAYVLFNVDKKEMYKLLIKCHYYLEDGTCIEKDESMIMSIDNPEENFSHPLLERIRGLRRDSKRVTPVSAEIYIETAID